MPLELGVISTPGGTTVLRVASHGTVTLDDANLLIAMISPGGEHDGKPLLGVMAEGAQLTVEARKRYSDLRHVRLSSPSAFVTTSAAERLLLNFVVKAASLGSKHTNVTKFFADEPSAMSWLDEQVQKPKP